MNDGKTFKGAGCALHFHDDNFFGLTRSDSSAMLKSDTTAWTLPGTHKMKNNTNKIETLKRKFEEGN